LSLRGFSYISFILTYFMARKKAIAKKEMKFRDDASGVFVPAGLLVGIGTGMLLGQVAAGTLIGLGVGFLLMAIVKMIKK
jgi:hypothetical protein